MKIGTRIIRNSFPTRAGPLVWYLLIMLVGCDSRPPPVQPIDAQWFRQSAVEHHLSRILVAAPTATGAFSSQFSRDWEPAPRQRYGPTMQGRVLYALASGYSLTRDLAYLMELKRGADFMLAYMVDHDSGGVFEAVDDQGKPLRMQKRLYSQAFALFGFAHAYQATRDKRYIDAATAIWDKVRLLMRDDAGGFVADSDRLFGKPGPTRNQNAIMHLFEAMLALHDATGDKTWLGHARSISDFVLTRLAQKTADDRRSIPEYYDANWRPQPSSRGGYIDLGHQVEWAWLLSAAAERGLPAYYVDTGAKLLDFAIATGYDRGRGGLYWRVDDKGAVSQEKIWWVQSEFLRAALRYAVKHDRQDLRTLFDQTLSFVRSEFLDTEKGGWTLRPKSSCQLKSCSNEQADVGYHIVAMHLEALLQAGAIDQHAR